MNPNTESKLVSTWKTLLQSISKSAESNAANAIHDWSDWNEMNQFSLWIKCDTNELSPNEPNQETCGPQEAIQLNEYVDPFARKEIHWEACSPPMTPRFQTTMERPFAAPGLYSPISPPITPASSTMGQSQYSYSTKGKCTERLFSLTSFPSLSFSGTDPLWTPPMNDFQHPIPLSPKLDTTDSCDIASIWSDCHEVDLQTVHRGFPESMEPYQWTDFRTTFMIRNIPNKVLVFK